MSKSSKITLVEGDEIISAYKDIAQIFDKFNKNAVGSLNIQCDTGSVNECDGLEDPVEIAIQKSKTTLALHLLKKTLFLQKCSNFIKLIFMTF